jgi:hypothetical protein
MTVSGTEPPAITLTLSKEERSLLLNFLEQKFRDKQIEEHRTEASQFRQYVQHEEGVLQGLLDKLRRS